MLKRVLGMVLAVMLLVAGCSGGNLNNDSGTPAESGSNPTTTPSKSNSKPPAPSQPDNNPSEP